jgi:chorismate synthase
LERASARETAARVAVGAICKKLIREFGIDVTGHVINIGGVQTSDERPSFATIKKRQENDPCRCIDANTSKEMQKRILLAQKRGDSLGGVFEIIFTHVPAGLGSCMHWDRKLDGILAKTLLSIQGIKGVEFGLGFEMADLFGSDVHDEIVFERRTKVFQHLSNNAGGIEGGMTNGEDIVLRAVMKPIPTLKNPLMSVNLKTKRPEKAAVHRADVCAVPAACVIAENCLCFDLANAVLEKFGGDSLRETKKKFPS